MNQFVIYLGEVHWLLKVHRSREIARQCEMCRTESFEEDKSFKVWLVSVGRSVFLYLASGETIFFRPKAQHEKRPVGVKVFSEGAKNMA